MTVRPLVAKGRMQWIKLCDIAREEEASLVVLAECVALASGRWALLAH